jgi:hypothetical protein
VIDSRYDGVVVVVIAASAIRMLGSGLFAAFIAGSQIDLPLSLS